VSRTDAAAGDYRAQPTEEKVRKAWEAWDQLALLSAAQPDWVQRKNATLAAIHTVLPPRKEG
jgi:hypothetical protein